MKKLTLPKLHDPFCPAGSGSGKQEDFINASSSNTSV